MIGSSSNVPGEFSLKDILKELRKKFEQSEINKLYDLLKMDTISDKLPLAKMSDGQKQKIKLLCFLASKPKIIILDEFTTALDKGSSLDLYAFLNEYRKNNEVTILNITHNLSDLEHMPGKYYYISDCEMKEVDSKETAIEKYIKGE
ncbi:ATP-binding cassette domain-containing protein [[Clostridium] polysaccharolyticum]|nr:ATP-binding cassette domain-containing protein [[Clostridium] polysaccharolyticum]